MRNVIEKKQSEVKAYVVGAELKEITLRLGDMTDAEREIILKRMPDQLLQRLEMNKRYKKEMIQGAGSDSLL